MFRMPPLSGPRIVGIGFNKTGTTSLGACFEQLGLGPVCSPPAVHSRYRSREADEDAANRAVEAPDLGDADARRRYFETFPWRSICDEILDNENYGPALQVVSGFRSFHDRPWGMRQLYRVIDAAYPGSKFILTLRDEVSWWRSVENWLTVTHADDRQKRRRYLKDLRLAVLNKDACIAAYRARNAAIRAYFAGRGDLLCVDFEAGDGWARLCGFLDRPVPDVPFPCANRQSYGQADR